MRAMNRMLKCPKCKQQTAYKHGGWAEDGRHYEEKQCNCGYRGQRKYMGLEMSKILRERLAESREV
jgi:Zn ribbon nucleic-acid-binding protein